MLFLFRSVRIWRTLAFSQGCGVGGSSGGAEKLARATASVVDTWNTVGGGATFSGTACGCRGSEIHPVKTVASIVTVHGCGRVFIQRARSKPVAGVGPSA